MFVDVVVVVVVVVVVIAVAIHIDVIVFDICYVSVEFLLTLLGCHYCHCNFVC